MAIVSAIPSDKLIFQQSPRSSIHNMDEESASGDEKYYHHPFSKPVVEKQTLRKEIKKKKGE